MADGVETIVAEQPVVIVPPAESVVPKWEYAEEVASIVRENLEPLVRQMAESSSTSTSLLREMLEAMQRENSELRAMYQQSMTAQAEQMGLLPSLTLAAITAAQTPPQPVVVETPPSVVEEGPLAVVPDDQLPANQEPPRRTRRLL